MSSKFPKNAPIEVIHEFPKATWLENLAIRPNGDILATQTLPVAQLWSVDPKKSREPVIVAKFPEVESLSGITELGNDKYYIAGGNLEFAELLGKKGSFKIWEIDFSAGGEAPKKRLVAELSEALFINGMCTLNDKLILLADSNLGGVWSLDVETGLVTWVIEDAAMAKTEYFNLGLNGIKVLDGYLYFTNSAQGSLCKIPIDMKSGKSTGSSTKISSSMPDDLVIDAAGNIWIAENPRDQFAVVPNALATSATDLDVTHIAGTAGGDELAGPTAVRFGRLENDKHSAYLTTTGSGEHYAKQDWRVGGTVSRIDLGSEFFEKY